MEAIGTRIALQNIVLTIYGLKMKLGVLLQKKYIHSLTISDDKNLGMEDIDNDDDINGNEKLIDENFLILSTIIDWNNSSNHEKCIKQIGSKDADANAAVDK